jgi:hypothetical protein
MIDIVRFIIGAVAKPFKSRLFILTFFLFFIPVSFFGIYYDYFGGGANSFFYYFTPKSIFTATAPLMATIIMEGALVSINRLVGADSETVEFQLLRDSLILSLIIMIIQCVIIYCSISSNDMRLSIISIFILLFFWVAICSSKSEFSPSKKWRATGNADTSSSNSIKNS